MPNIDDVEKDLLARAGAASTADLGTIAEALKALGETKFTELTARNKAREIRLETFKSAATFLVPIVSLLALLGTIYVQSEQMAANRQQIEDTEWRDLLGSLKGASDPVYSDPTVAPRLRSFFPSAVYGDQAKSIAGRLMGHISNPDGFRDLFTAVFVDVNTQSVASVLDIGRGLLSSKQSLNGRCNDLLTAAKVPYDAGLVDCGNYIDDAHLAELTAKLNVPAEFASMGRSDRQLDRENAFIDTKIVAYLRTHYQVPRDRRSNPGLDLSGSNFVFADFSDLDLTDFSIAGTIFDTVDLRGAILAPKGPTLNRVGGGPGQNEQPDFRGSPWWEARFVEPTLLRFLADWYFPYLQPNMRYPAGYSITQDDYRRKLAALCASANLACPLPVKFGVP